MIAIDTNVLVYAVDADEPVKGDMAVNLLRTLESQHTVLLWQVSCEFGAVLHRNRTRGKIDVDAQKSIDAWSSIFPIVLPTERSLRTGWRLARDLKISYWDAMLIGACVDAGVNTLYTEDTQSAPIIDGVRLINPFA